MLRKLVQSPVKSFDIYAFAHGYRYVMALDWVN